MGTSDEAERMAREDPQPGMSTFDRNHTATMHLYNADPMNKRVEQSHTATMHLYNADPMNKRVEQRTLALRLRDRFAAIVAGDKFTAMMLIEAAVALEHATFAEGIWEERARKAERRLTQGD
ncbi:MAG: hypothetical protein RLZZ93_1549 [Actinomycetota bacterium]